MMMSFFFLTVALADWIVIYDGLSEQNFPVSDLTSWTYRTDCSGGGGGGCTGTPTVTCDQNPNKYVKLDSVCNRWRRDFPVSFPYFKLKVVAALILLDQSSAQMKIDVENTNIYTLTVVSATVNYNKNNCLNTMANALGQRTVVAEGFETTNNVRVTFCYDQSSSSKIVGVRHVTISLNNCHWSCRGCTAGDTSSQCTSCYTGSPSGGVCPSCPANTQFIDLSYTTCQQECDRSKQFNVNKVCSTSTIISTLATELSTTTFTTHSWTFIPDPQYYTLSVTNRITTCDTRSHIGAFSNNEAVENTFTLSSALVREVRLRATIFVVNWDEAASVQILINDILRERLYYSGGQYLTLSSTKIFDQSSTCSWRVRIEFQFLTTTLNLKIKFQGNMQIGLQQQWGLRDVFIDEIVCAANCNTCASSQTCQSCSATYFLYRGSCISACPPFSTVSGSVCTDYEDAVSNSVYLVKALYDTTSTSETDAEQVMGTYTNMAGTNFVTGYRFGFLPTRRVFGGPFSWHKAQFTRTFSGLDPHYGYRIMMKIYLGEGAGTFTYTFTGFATVTITSGTASSSTANLWGKTNDELTYDIDRSTTAVTGDITIFVSYVGPGSPNDGFAAISDYYLILYKCMPFCNACTSGTTCSSWAALNPNFSSYNPLACNSARYLDTSTSPYTCPQCASGCTSCTSLTTCSSCSSNFYLLEGVCYCNNGLYLNGATCSNCHDSCLTCNGGTSTSCFSCKPTQFRILSKNTCICQQYFEDAAGTNICQPICGDLYVTTGEDCDDGNNVPFDGCHECKYSCPLKCLTCAAGKCTTCISGYAYNSALKACVPVCGDLIFVQPEECEDGNSRTLDSCYLCKYQCDSYCSLCTYGVCYSCIAGFRLNNANGRCDPVCGDQLKVHDEECDDGNLDGSDGCWNCQFQCPTLCATCVFGQCLSCQNGYTLTKNNTCKGTCGNLSVQFDEQCDDGNTSNQDGCYKCMWLCQPECTNCAQGVCSECNTQGWTLNSVSNRCIPVHGDGVMLVLFEQCDDSTQDPFDGCFQTKYSCDEFCYACADGTCYGCLSGFKQEGGRCTPICGDRTRVGYESCDDGNYVQLDNCYECRFQCQAECTNCVYGVCQQCASGFYLNAFNQCQATCGDSLTVQIEICDDGNKNPLDGCYQCKQECSEECESCANNQCIQCKSGWSLNLDGQCETICGDLARTKTEQCDDGNSVEYDGCFQCSLQCEKSCLNCFYGVCVLCQSNFQLISGRCYPTCGLAMLLQPQTCLDSELDPFDGCFLCQLVCDEQCISCNNGYCIQCNEGSGYYLSELTNKCESKCGDNKITKSEQCDDFDNSVTNDGCYDCKFSCIKYCKTCNYGVCADCQTGYYLTNGNCSPQCGDLITVEEEQCDSLDQNCLSCLYVCQPQCLFCIQGQCLYCYEVYGWYLNTITGVCESKCGDIIVNNTEECDDNEDEPDLCLNCQWVVRENCSSSSQGICQQCKEGYFLDTSFNQCVSICGDQLVVEKEQCDDGNFENNDGCFLCQWSCDFFCLNCQTGVCWKCMDGFSLNEQNQCLPICGDNQITAMEACDDNNSIKNDGCYSCKYLCSEYCIDCQQGRCFLCAPGWILNDYDRQCQPVSGDGIIVFSFEECGDDNNIPFDGCYQSTYSCSESCQSCVLGICNKCNDGYQIDEFGNCIPICGDAVASFPEQCDDGQNDQSYDGCFHCTFNCHPKCEFCSYGKCQQCAQGYLLSTQFQCISQCGDSNLADNEQCEDANLQPFDGCFQCQPSCQESCEECLGGLCQKCKQGFLLNGFTNECETICGDLIISEVEQCDDGNDLNQDGCEVCILACDSNCNFCSYGKCQACKAGYYLDDKQFCQPFCGDEIVAGLEACDDGNLIQGDGCFGCNYSCQPECLDCLFGLCQQCQEAQGYYLLEGKCQPQCGDSIVAGVEQCEDGNSIKFDSCFQCQYLCPENCANCDDNGYCLSCMVGFVFDRNIGQCVPQCKDLSALSNKCCQDEDLDFFNGCSNICTLSCQSTCVECVNGQCQLCEEQFGWYLDEATFTCKSICGDTIIASDEECDDGNAVQEDGCFECLLRCQENCKQCDYGLCQECKPGYYLGENKLCSSVCGDGIVAGLEVCEDENDILYDGCYECQFSCQPSCIQCARGICYECELPGWELDSVIGQCKPICGDRLVVGYEQCDDGNLTPYDGCYECLLQCQLVCTRCLGGECHECNTPGWELIGIMCHEICGDGLVVGNEHCEDNNLIQYDGCFNCKFDCEEPCIWCNMGACLLCKQGWQVKEYRCEPICGDSQVNGIEQCDDGNDLPYDGCYLCKYSCDLKCVQCGAGGCFQCEPGWYVDPIGICLPFCGDKIIQIGYEICDDGNSIQGDGCHDCEYSCHFACTVCQRGVCASCDTEGWELLNGTCVEICGDEIQVGSELCDDGNLVPHDGCFNCAYSCHKNCLECQRGVCVLCDIGWYQHEDQCRTVCGDGIYVSQEEKCDDGNSKPRDGCSDLCQVESSWFCDGDDLSVSICTQSDSPKMILEVNDTRNDFAQLYLNFTTPVKLANRFSNPNKNFSYMLNATILQAFDHQYLISIKELNKPKLYPTNVLYEFQIQYKESLPRIVLEVRLQPNHLVSIYEQEVEEYLVQQTLSPSEVISEEDRKRSIQAQEFTTIVIISMGGVAVMSLLTGQFSIISNLLDQIQIISYIKYINIQFPENLNIFFDAFKIVDLKPLLKIIGFDRIFSSIFDDDPNECPSHGKFVEDNLNSCFSYNFQSFIFCLIAGYASYFGSKLILSGFEKLGNYQFRKLDHLISKALLEIRMQLFQLKEEFHFSGLTRILQANYYNITFAALMQLSNQNSSSIDSIFQTVSAVAVFATQLIVTVYVFHITKKLIADTSALKKNQFTALFDGLSQNMVSFWSLQYNSLLLAKKLLFMLTLTRLQDNGMIQSIIVSLSSLLLILFMVKQQPLVSRIDTCKIIISETVIAFTALTFVIYDFADEMKMTYHEQLLLGWVHISAYGGSLFSTLILDVAQETYRLYGKFKKAYTRRMHRSNSSNSNGAHVAPLFY